MKGDCYEYVRNYYGVPAYVGVRVTVKGRDGALADHRPSDQYVYILFDGDRKPRGPYHPTDGIDYRVEGARSVDAIDPHATDPGTPSTRV